MPTSGGYEFFDGTNILPNAVELSTSDSQPTDGTPTANGDATVPPVVDIVPVVQECEKVKASLENAIISQINECLSLCQTIGSECNACVNGKSQILFDAIGKVANTCGEKILTNLWNKVINTGNAMKEIGIPPPTPEQLAAAANGDEIPPPPPPPVPMPIDDIIQCADGQAAEIVNGVLTCVPPPPVPPIYQGPIETPIPVPAPFPTNGGGQQPGVGGPCGANETIIFDQTQQRYVCIPQVQPPPPPSGGLEYWAYCSSNGGGTTQVSSPSGWQVGYIFEAGGGTQRAYHPDQLSGPPAPWTSYLTDGPFTTNADAIAANLARETVPGSGNVCPGVIPPPPPPPNGTCPPPMECKAGYHWGTDENGNPACVPDNECPPCPDGNGDKPPPKPLEKINGIEFCDPAEWSKIGGMIENTIGQFNLKSWSESLGSSGFVADIAQGVFISAAEILTNISIGAVTGEGTGTCQSPAFRALAGVNALVGFLGHFGLAPHAMQASYRYSLNYMCQWHIPTQPELNAAAVRHYITQNEWEYGAKLNGECLPWQKHIKELGYSRIGIRDAYRLRKLDEITENEYVDGLRRNAVDTENDRFYWEKAQIQYPPMSDLIRMMQRDIVDEKVVRKLNLKDKFPKKWREFLKKWGESQGVNDEVAEAYWMAHWQNAAPGHIYQWLHRFRPDDRDPNDPNIGLTVTTDDAKQYLEIADYVPGLIQYYIGASYLIPGRIDIRRMYRVGVIKDETGLRRKYRDLGYNAKDAADLARFTVITETPAKSKLAGAMQESEVLRLYTDAVIGKDQATRLLLDAGIPVDSIGQKLESADIRRHSIYVKKVRSALQKRFFMGEFTQAEVAGELERNGTDSDFVNTLAAQWEQERRGRSKHVALGKLCEMFDRGLIGMDEYMRRVRNLNYPEADALLLIENCVIGIRERQADALVKEQQRQVKQAQAAAREAARLRREMRPCRVVKPVCKNGQAGER